MYQHVEEIRLLCKLNEFRIEAWPRKRTLSRWKGKPRLGNTSGWDPEEAARKTRDRVFPKSRKKAQDLIGKNQAEIGTLTWTLTRDHQLSSSALHVY